MNIRATTLREDATRRSRVPAHVPGRGGGGRRRGTTTVEAAIVLPLLMILMFGLLEYGWLFLKVQETTSIARQAARLASLPDATLTGVEGEIARLMGEAGMGDAAYVVTIDPADWGDVEKGDPVMVAIRVPYDEVRISAGGFIPTPATIGGAVTMAKEGPD